MRYVVAILGAILVLLLAAPAHSQYDDTPPGMMSASLTFGYDVTSTTIGKLHTFSLAPGFRVMVTPRLGVGAEFAIDWTTLPGETHTRQYFGGSFDYYVGHPDWIDAEFYPFAEGAIGVVHAASDHPLYWYEQVGVGARVGFGANIMIDDNVAVTPVLMYVYEDTNYYRQNGQVVLMVSVDAFFRHF